MQRAHSTCQHSFCGSAPTSVRSPWAAFYLAPLPSVPFIYLSFLKCFHVFLSHRISSIGSPASSPTTFCLQDLGFVFPNDVFQYLNRISRPTFPLTPPTSLLKCRLSASSHFSFLPSGPLCLVLLCPLHLPYSFHPLLSIKPSDLPAHACLCRFHRLTPPQQMCLAFMS